MLAKDKKFPSPSERRAQCLQVRPSMHKTQSGDDGDDDSDDNSGLHAT